MSQAMPQKFLIYGDLGAEVPAGTTSILPYVSKEVLASRYDMILHVGDFAYDLESNNGNLGRTFMNQIQNISAYVPYMVDVGNHESGYHFAHYTEIFRNMPSNTIDTTVKTDNGIAPNNWFFSWNVGLVHFISISTEIYFNNPEMIPSQWNWLRKDLSDAYKNRTNAPWIIVNGHRPMYCSCSDDCNGNAALLRSGTKQFSDDNSLKYGLEPLLSKYGVDMYISGHAHNYERSFDISPNETFDYLAGISTYSTTNPPGTIYIVSGDAGNAEDPLYRAFQYPQPDRTAFRSEAFGFSRMMIHNSSHMYWEQLEFGQTNDPHVMDSFWLIQYNHRSFQPKKNKRKVLNSH